MFPVRQIWREGRLALKLLFRHRYGEEAPDCLMPLDISEWPWAFLPLLYSIPLHELGAKGRQKLCYPFLINYYFLYLFYRPGRGPIALDQGYVGRNFS